MNGEKMAKHEFGIMPEAPRQGERYDRYEPQKQACISVEDDDLEKTVERFSSLDLYWHTLSVKGKGLAYCGITLIPPDLLKACEKITADIPALHELTKLFEKAEKQNKWVIHYGI